MDKKIQDGQQIKWVSEEQNFTYVHDFKFCERIRNKIETIYKLPSIKSETGYALETVLTCVRLRSG